MRLFEMKTKPVKLGKATLVYDNSPTPARDKSIIRIPNNSHIELFIISNHGRFDQFLLVSHGPSDVGFWFGGTDENPFLVQLNNAPFRNFIAHGEPGFYTSLVAQRVLDLSMKTRRRYLRQGDIFAVPMNMSWHTLLKSLDVARWGDGRNHLHEDKSGYRVFGTRHLLTGSLLTMTCPAIYNVNVPAIASGVIEAPDHSPLELGGSPHAMFQTENLYSPKNAD